MKRIVFGLALFCIVFAIGFRIVWQGHQSVPGMSTQASTEMPIPRDLEVAAKEFYDFVSNPNGLTYQNCASTLGEIYSDLYKIKPESFDIPSAQKNFKEITKTLFLARAALRDRLRDFPIKASADPEDPCISRTRDIFRLSRFLEDYLGEMFLGVKPFEEGKDPEAFGTFTGEAPWLLKTPQHSEITLRSGDVIISRGNAFTSAAIARITKIDSQFSHVAFIYIEGDTSGKAYTLEQALAMPNVLVLEAHIEIGSTIRTLKEYLADGNARNVLFRYKDAQVAHQAAKWTHQFMVNYTDRAYKRRFLHIPPTEMFLPKNHPDFHVPYDFKMDMSNTKEVFCSEVAGMGFAAQKVNLPLYPSLITPAKDNALVKSLGITTQRIYAPGDTELDTRFEMIAEWRDYRKVQSLRYKDAVLVAMFDWMQSKKYEFYRSPIIIAGATGFWLARWFDFPKISINGHEIFNVTKKLPKNMTPKIASTVETLNRTADILEKYIQEQEAIDRKNHENLVYVLPQMLDKLEQLRAKDSELFEQGERTLFHQMFRPSSLTSPVSRTDGP